MWWVSLLACGSGEVPLLTWLEDHDLGWRGEPAVHPSLGPNFGWVQTFFNLDLDASLRAEAAERPRGAAAVKELLGGPGSAGPSAGRSC